MKLVRNGGHVNHDIKHVLNIFGESTGRLTCSCEAPATRTRCLASWLRCTCPHRCTNTTCGVLHILLPRQLLSVPFTAVLFIHFFPSPSLSAHYDVLNLVSNKPRFVGKVIDAHFREAGFVSVHETPRTPTARLAVKHSFYAYYILTCTYLVIYAGLACSWLF
jgi:hypothetical protein